MSGIGQWLKRNGTSSSKQTKRHQNGNSEDNADDSARSQDSQSNSDGHRDRGGHSDEDEDMTLADSDYARKRRELLRLARSLEDLGANELIELPRIVVIGAQSAGKSSLVEAVTGVSGCSLLVSAASDTSLAQINVPRDSGTCTRCPMECTILTAQSSAWSCAISLRFLDGDRQASQTRTVQGFSPLLTRKADVELWIRRAQAAVLCPHMPMETFRNKSRDELRVLTDADVDPAVLRFTRSVVVVDIEDPSGVDLSFVDLPGLVQNVEDDSIIALVEQMVKEYIQQESTVILVTLPATVDLENQQALKFARLADPEGRRTIGVVTKPDGLGDGDSGMRGSWQNIFEEKATKHRLRKGYYCVRLLNDEERRKKVSRAKAEQIARRFFDETAPWKHLKRTRRLGTRNLVRDISRILVDIIQEAVPKMRRATAERLAQCHADLEGLPRLLSSDPTAEAVRCVVDFCNSMRRAVHGEGEDKSFVRQCRHEFRAFARAIRETAPDFRPSTTVDANQGRIELVGETQSDVDDDASVIDFMEIPSPPISLVDVRRVIKESTGWELPHNIPYEAKVRLIKRFMEHWPAAKERCFDRVVEDLNDELLKQSKDHFGRFLPLEQLMRSTLAAQMETYVGAARAIVKNSLERELAPYGTQNNPYLDTMRDKWFARYKQVRADPQNHGLHRLPSSSDVLTAAERNALTALRALGYANVSVHDLVRLYPRDAYEDEMTVMADVRSYFQVVYKRVADDIPEAIKLNLVFEFIDSLQGHLIDSLRLGAPDAPERMRVLLAEDPSIARERARLQDQLRRLKEIKAKLDHFEM
ncbi:hypothetical protein BV20DRAFT_480715 [Pilatotrama ljubarskyi]|nr:hypothetical protein BV20DRAFT_480715 [Pilatotrama ljubarskyi]